MFDSWLTLSGAASGFDLRGALQDPDAPGSGHGWGQPAKFATHQDAQSRFEIGYPMGWELHAGEGVHVRSKHLSSFAQVDILPTSPGIWQTLQAAVAKAAGSLTILRDIPGEIRQLRGRLEFQEIRFDIHAWAYPRGNETIVLTTGSVAVPDSSAQWRLYHEQVLTAIHRAFRVHG